MPDDSKDLGTTQISEDKVFLTDDSMNVLRVKPDDYVEIFSYSGIGQMEFAGLSYIDDDNGVYIPDEILEKLEDRTNARQVMGKEMIIVRIEAPEQEGEEISTRLRQAIRGTLTTKKPAVEMRLYKHICDIIRYGSTHDYIPLGNTCALCGEPLKGREKVITYKSMKPICVRCGKEVAGNYCGNCGLKLRRRDKERKCATCGNHLEFIDKYSRFYCYTCKKYERSIKPGVKNATCPDCKKSLSYVKKYDRWYCFDCKGYRKPTEITPESEKGICMVCKGNLVFVEKYSRFFCRKCDEYRERSMLGQKTPQKTAPPPQSDENDDEMDDTDDEEENNSDTPARQNIKKNAKTQPQGSPTKSSQSPARKDNR